jgi:hypothetical protein
VDEKKKSQVDWTKRRRILDAIDLLLIVLVLFLFLGKIISLIVFEAGFFVLVVVYLSLYIMILYRKKANK